MKLTRAVEAHQVQTDVVSITFTLSTKEFSVRVFEDTMARNIHLSAQDMYKKYYDLSPEDFFNALIKEALNVETDKSAFDAIKDEVKEIELEEKTTEQK